MTDHDDLLNLPRPKWDHHEIAILGGRQEDDLAIALGYLTAAEVTARHWIEHGPDDSLPIPILYLYRHSIELSLKWLIRVAAAARSATGIRGLRTSALPKWRTGFTRTTSRNWRTASIGT